MEPGFLNKQPKRMRPDTDWCLPNMPEGSIQPFSSYAETDRSRLSCTPICYHKQKGRYLLQNKVDSDFLENNLVCLAQYRSKYTNHKTVDQRNSKFTKQEYTFLQMWLGASYFLPVGSLVVLLGISECAHGQWAKPIHSLLIVNISLYFITYNHRYYHICQSFCINLI